MHTKSPRSHQHGSGLRLAATLLALAAAALANAAPESFSVDVNTAALAAQPGQGPYSLDFQWNYGSGAGDTVSIGGLQLTGGALVAGTGTYLSGSGTGSLGTSLSITNSAASPFNEFVQQMTPGVTDVKFHLDFSGPTTGAIPSGFSFTIDDGSTFPIFTSAPDTLSLIRVDFDGTAPAVVASYSSVAPSPLGVSGSVAVPDTANTAGLVTTAICALGLAQRMRRKSSFRAA